MTTTIIAMYDNADDAQQALNEIVRSGFRRDEIDLLRGDGKGATSLVSDLTKRGVEEQEAAVYAKAMGKGAVMLALEAADETAKDALAILNRSGARDLEELVAGAELQHRESVPVVEEQVSIGKRRVLRGGLRVTSVVSERPIEETVSLTEEKVSVDRTRTDRKLSPEEAEKAFQQQTLEVTESAEEAVISKEARVIEEVSIAKTAEQHEETVRATARRTDVKVEEIDPRLVKSRK